MSFSNKKKKLKAYKFGLWSEFFAILYFLCKGYFCIARRYKSPTGEVDLILKKGQLIVFVEVKGRSCIGGNYELVSKYQLGRIINSANLFMKKYPHLSYRVDIFVFSKNLFEIHHFKNITN